MERTCSCCGRQSGDFVTLHRDRSTAICWSCLAWLDQQRDRTLAGRSDAWVARSLEPVFEVRDLDRALAHYELLGFDVDRHDEGYGFARHDREVTIHLSREDAPRPGVAYLHCDDAATLAERWRLAGVVVVGPDPMPWGMLEGHSLDPDANELRFGSEGGPPST